MIATFLKTETFHSLFSLILGVASIAILKPICVGDGCAIARAPPKDELKESVYQVGGRCYRFHIHQAECPSSGVIEAFERFA